jgi:hypothetical protein
MKNMKNKTAKIRKCFIYRDTKLYLQLELLCRGNIESKKTLQADYYFLGEGTERL